MSDASTPQELTVPGASYWMRKYADVLDKFSESAPNFTAWINDRLENLPFGNLPQDEGDPSQPFALKVVPTLNEAPPAAVEELKRIGGGRLVELLGGGNLFKLFGLLKFLPNLAQYLPEIVALIEQVTDLLGVSEQTPGEA